ncbi:flagellar basal-body rod protein FlgF [Geomonas limicola]|uniref:Flagellar basal-body rod protein FlgF n=1 Tax=Geomonas limicola TaxID=2740186 RepID=A0A6V8NDZ2_9BACT|nr:flagellar basal-body rod protein FlgF [Geomonas limicola]GFO70858.1 flagellar basal-body rod protein FlgF [Geomonas limicola]
MNSGMYAALSGNLTAVRRLEVVSNNLANASTPGFKADQLQFESVLANVKKPTSQDPALANERFYTDFTPGPLQKSDNVFDVALEGDGFFVVNTPDGPAYTRQGNFHRGAGGKLVTAEGYEVQGQGGSITVSGKQVMIDGKGAVNVDGNAVATLSTVDFPKPYQLTKLGSGLFRPADPQATPTPSTAQVKQGFLEGSNVKVMVEMARMIEANRYFELCSKAVKSYDDLATKAVNELGKV